MRCAIALFSTLLLLPITSSAQNKVEIEDLAHHPLESSFPSGGILKMRIRSAEIHIVGSDEKKIALHVGGNKGSDSDDVRAHFERIGDAGDLRITGGPSSEVTITVQVPRN